MGFPQDWTSCQRIMLCSVLLPAVLFMACLETLLLIHASSELALPFERSNQRRRTKRTPIDSCSSKQTETALIRNASTLVHPLRVDNLN